MIVGTGIDIVHVSRMNHWLDNENLCLRYFHDDEIEFVRSRGSGAVRSLAARFAAKEAFAKALGTGFVNLALRDIRVYSEGNGRPHLVLKNSAEAGMKRAGAISAHLSLAHDGDMAVAQVILEG